jgi:hypothetical protein
MGDCRNISQVMKESITYIYSMFRNLAAIVCMLLQFTSTAVGTVLAPSIT